MTPARAICCALALFLIPLTAFADPVRVASFNTELQRDGPGLLLRDIRRGEDPQILAVVSVIAQTSPDVLALQGFDWDYDGTTLAAFTDLLRTAGTDYPYHFSPRPNSGMATDLDLDGDGRRSGPGDAQGYGSFSGQGGLAVLSRFPILTEQAQDYSTVLWRDVPDALLPRHENGTAFPSLEAQAIQRLSSTAHWAVPAQLPDGTVLTLLTFQAAPPVFDGPEDRNGRRNHDEILLWRHVLNGVFGPAPEGRFVLAGGANLDPSDSDGRRIAIQTLLADPRFQDVIPRSDRLAVSASDATDTVDWPKVGQLRVDYVVPSAKWNVAGAGVFWPASGAPGHADALAASRHRLVWVDLRLPEVAR